MSNYRDTRLDFANIASPTIFAAAVSRGLARLDVGGIAKASGLSHTTVRKLILGEKVSRETVVRVYAVLGLEPPRPETELGE